MSKEYTLADFTDIFDYSTGWFSDSSICSLFYQIFKRFPSMKMVKYKVNQDFLKEIKNFISKTMRSIYSSIYIAIILRMKRGRGGGRRYIYKRVIRLHRYLQEEFNDWLF